MLNHSDAPHTGSRRVLHVLSQRPSLTGSGITLDALVRLAGKAGWEQQVVAGVPAGGPHPEVGGLPPEQIHPLTFAGVDERANSVLPYPVPGMSDVMPYRSSRWSRLSAEQVDNYDSAWRRHLSAVIAKFRPQVIHAHHAWLVSSMIKELAPEIPLAVHGHGTGLRQMILCPHLAGRVRNGLADVDQLLVLHQDHVEAYVEALGIPANRVTVAGAGYREDLFHARGRGTAGAPALLYAGKLSRAKGLPWLLDAVEMIAGDHPGLVLHVAGGGDGEEGEALRLRMARMAPLVAFHGRLDQQDLASLMRRSSVFVLPSFYEGLPLVLVEALASGCRLVATALPGVVRELSPRMGELLTLVTLPRLEQVDKPMAEDLPAFTEALAGALKRSLQTQGPVAADTLESFTWGAVFQRVEQIWNNLLEGP